MSQLHVTLLRSPCAHSELQELLSFIAAISDLRTAHERADVAAVCGCWASGPSAELVGGIREEAAARAADGLGMGRQCGEGILGVVDATLAASVRCVPLRDAACLLSAAVCHAPLDLPRSSGSDGVIECE